MFTVSCLVVVFAGLFCCWVWWVSGVAGCCGDCVFSCGGLWCLRCMLVGCGGVFWCLV